MPYAPRADRLLRDELLLYQRRVLREWCEDDSFAARDPVGWRACDEADPAIVRVALTNGDDAPEPGAIVCNERGTADVPWNVGRGLPFEDRTVDALVLGGAFLRGLEDETRRALPRHLARVLRVGGTLTVAGLPAGMADALADAAFDEEELREDGRRRFTLVSGKTPLADAAPLTVDERVYGERVVREPRVPYRR